jgi:hypothetical protein
MKLLRKLILLIRIYLHLYQSYREQARELAELKGKIKQLQSKYREVIS